MNVPRWPAVTILLLVGSVGLLSLANRSTTEQPLPPGRSEVIFWHFWGGQDRPIVEAIVADFNASQEEYFVRALAMPGNNLDLKFFLATTGGDPPDVVNQDDPIVADWAFRGALTPLDELATPEEMEALPKWLYPAAQALGSYDHRMYALCNGLDIRALYYDQTVLDEFQLQPPRTLAELDHLAETIAPTDTKTPHNRFGYLPDPRRLWAWGIVFGGSFYNAENKTITANSPEVVNALSWMASYSDKYGADRVAAFRKGDQALSGSAFPLLQGRYAVIMDGQWRVRELSAAQATAKAAGKPVHEYGVVPLPPPPDGKQNAGWVNGNFFLVPRGSKNPAGAWAFMKYWSGFAGNEQAAAKACAAGGWIPASEIVVQQPEFQKYLAQQPLFRKFVELAKSPAQVPIPPVPVAAFYQSEVIRAAEQAIYRGSDPKEVLDRTTTDVTRQLQAVQADR